VPIGADHKFVAAVVVGVDRRPIVVLPGDRPPRKRRCSHLRGAHRPHPHRPSAPTPRRHDAPTEEGFDRCEPTAGIDRRIRRADRWRQPPRPRAVAVGGAVGAVAGVGPGPGTLPCLRVVTRINFALKGLANTFIFRILRVRFAGRYPKRARAPSRLGWQLRTCRSGVGEHEVGLDERGEALAQTRPAGVRRRESDRSAAYRAESLRPSQITRSTFHAESVVSIVASASATTSSPSTNPCYPRRRAAAPQ